MWISEGSSVLSSSDLKRQANINGLRYNRYCLINIVWLEARVYINLGLKAYPADYVAVEGDAHKRCYVRILIYTYTYVGKSNLQILIWQEGKGTDNRPASGQMECLCDTDDCNANQYAAPGAAGAAPKVRSDPES